MTTSTNAPIAVLGATGQQGGAVATALLDRGAVIRAVVRDPGKARTLADRGAQISVADIGQAAATALLDPATVPGGAVELAGDERTGEEVTALFARERGLPARFEPVPVDALRNPDAEAMFTWFTRVPAYTADFDTTRTLVGAATDFPAFVARHPAP